MFIILSRAWSAAINAEIERHAAVWRCRTELAERIIQLFLDGEIEAFAVGTGRTESANSSMAFMASCDPEWERCSIEGMESFSYANVGELPKGVNSLWEDLLALGSGRYECRIAVAKMVAHGLAAYPKRFEVKHISDPDTLYYEMEIHGDDDEDDELVDRPLVPELVDS